MDNLNFKVSAELKNILGKDLITSPNIAILELVKNSYDAHATKVEITFDEDKLIIADNGKGMSLDDLINKWLFVAYSAKSDGTEDLSYRSKIKRHYAGAKGIGRMSCDRLAKFLTLTTRSIETQSTEILHVDWSAFDDNAKLQFASINIPHETSTEIPSFPEDKPNGTILEFSGLHSDWHLYAIKSLRQSLAKMINPFAEADNFKIEIIAPAFADNDKNMQKEFEALSADWDNLDDRRRGAITAKKLDIINGPIENSIADVLKLKTTQIESRIVDGIIKTILYDRGVKMYEIEEQCPYGKLSDASVSLLYLNRAAKYSFSVSMGVTPVKYGNVFLFRNGIRIWPYGEWNDDSWGLNQRAQQGYNRFLGTRDLFGRVNVETDSITDFKEVSSRDGGLIETAATLQLKDYFRQIHSRLERYVVGVLWGEGFLKKDYFTSENIAKQARAAIQENDKDSETTEFVFQNIGSRVDFLQLIKSLVNEPTIEVKYFNTELANIVQSVSDSELIQIKLLDDLRKVAKKTSEDSLLARLDEFEKILAETNRQKEDAIQQAEKAKKQAAEESAKRKKVEAELRQKTKQNLFLQSVSSLDLDRILKFHHDIRIQAGTIKNTVSSILKNAYKKRLDIDNVIKYVERISRANDRVMSIAQFATKANFNTDADEIEADIVEFIAQYVNVVLPQFYDDCVLSCEVDNCSKVVKFMPLEVSLMIDNLIGNSIKADAKQFHIRFTNVESQIEMSVTDNGHGLLDELSNPNVIFEKGYTTTNGSGLGLYNVSKYVKETLHGTIHVENGKLSGQKGFCLIITF